MADKKAETGSHESETKLVVDLLGSILSEVQKQVLSEVRKLVVEEIPPLQGKALEAVNLFREIGATLALLPSITLTASRTQIDKPGGPVTLTWSSTEAQTVFLEKQELGGVLQKVADLTPVAVGNIEVTVSVTTKFMATATAKGPCNSAMATVDVIVDDIDIE